MSQRDQEAAERTGEDEAPTRLGGRIRGFWAQPTYRFAVFFLVYLTIIAVGYPILRERIGPLLQLAEDVTARVVYAVMSPFSDEVRMSGDRAVFFGPFVVTVIEECTGLYEALLLGAALLAFPASWTKAVIGFAIGFPMIYAMNVLRICLLLVVGRYLGGESFEFFHVYFWQVTMILMVASTWLVWVTWIVRGEYGERRTV